MVELRTALVVTASVSLPVSIIGVAPTMFEQPLATGGPARDTLEHHERMKFTPLGIAGRDIYVEQCAMCHGRKGNGTKRGPSLLLETYNRTNLGKQSFHYAVSYGVPQQRWAYGDMPAFPRMSFNQVEMVERFVRELQSPLSFR